MSEYAVTEHKCIKWREEEKTYTTEELREQFGDRCLVSVLLDEIEQLQAKVKRLEGRGIQDMHHEIKRLREALQTILTFEPYSPDEEAMIGVASRALEGGDEDE